MFGLYQHHRKGIAGPSLHCMCLAARNTAIPALEIEHGRTIRRAIGWCQAMARNALARVAEWIERREHSQSRRVLPVSRSGFNHLVMLALLIKREASRLASLED